MDAAAPSPLTIRPATSNDTEFLVWLFAARRALEPGGRSPTTSALRDAYLAHEDRHRDLHPAATHHVVELARQPIGQCRLGPHPERDSEPLGDHLFLVDLSLHPDHDHLTDAVIEALHRHADWFGVRLHTPDTSPVSEPTGRRPDHYGAPDDRART